MRYPTKLQQDVIEFPYISGTTLKVEAGPGSGKSYTLLCKVFYLISSNQMQPEEIIIASLTNKAVDNIIENMLKVFHELNQDQYTDVELDRMVSQVGVYTLHGLSNVIVTENIGAVEIIEENGWRGILKLIPDDFWMQRGINTINSKTAVKQLEKMINDDTNKERVDLILESVKRFMKASNVLTNSDLIKMAVSFLNEPSDDYETPFTNFLLKNSKILIIDEFQDLYPEVSPLIETLALRKQLIMFGDTNQSIYEFLGSNTEVLRRLDKIRNSKSNFVKVLIDNFRSTPELTAAANCIAKNTIPSSINHQTIITKEPSGMHPSVHNFDEVNDELDFLISEISQLLCASAKFSDIAILTRTNAHSKVIADHLTAYGIPVKKLTAQPDWMSDPKIRFIIDIMQAANKVSKESALKESFGLKSDFSIIVALASIKGLSSTDIQQLHQIAMSSNMSIWKYLTQTPSHKWPMTNANRLKVSLYIKAMSELICDICNKKELSPSDLLFSTAKMMARMDLQIFKLSNENEVIEFRKNLQEFYTSMKLSELSKPQDQNMLDWYLETFLDQSIILHNHLIETDDAKENKGEVNISTIHSSKGLEFPVVFLMGRNGNGTFPIDTKTLYVGMTRARNMLYLINVKHPRINLLPSSFEPVIKKQNFWKYYNHDLKRSVLSVKDSNEHKYMKLQKQFGIGSRNMHTSCKYLKSISKFII